MGRIRPNRKQGPPVGPGGRTSGPRSIRRPRPRPGNYGNVAPLPGTGGLKGLCSSVNSAISALEYLQTQSREVDVRRIVKNLADAYYKT